MVYDEVAPGLRKVVQNSAVPERDDLWDVLGQPGSVRRTPG
jgi:hypothetical protein